MLGIKQIKASGEIVSLGLKPLSLQEMQALVATGRGSALIEYFPGYEAKAGKIVLVLNEEGRIHNLEVNHIASEMTKSLILGDVLIAMFEKTDFEEPSDEEE